MDVPNMYVKILKCWKDWKIEKLKKEMDKHWFFFKWNFKIGITQMPVLVVKKFLQNGSVQYNLWCPYFSDSGQASKSCDIFQSFSTSPALKVLTMDTFAKSCPTFAFCFFLKSSWVQLMDPNFKSALSIFEESAIQKWVFFFWRMI